MIYDKFEVGHDVVGGSARFFVRVGKKEIEKWNANATPVIFVNPNRTIWDKFNGRTFLGDCVEAHDKIQSWCDWANKEFENDRKLEIELDNMFRKV